MHATKVKNRDGSALSKETIRIVEFEFTKYKEYEEKAKKDPKNTEAIGKKQVLDEALAAAKKSSRPCDWNKVYTAIYDNLVLGFQRKQIKMAGRTINKYRMIAIESAAKSLGLS